ncbi:MAG: hypothetical protein GC165_08495 [Armatimonadetes bacterium]|nr:hypothetical protein [Armatimonadota bacterium]
MSSAPSPPAPQNWFMYHGGYDHAGYIPPTSTSLSSSNVNSSTFGLLNSINVSGPILSVPAVVDGFIYVGVANSHKAPGSIGGSILKINILTGEQMASFTWPIEIDERDAHGFTGMGCTPTVINNFVYFVGFNAKLYCLNQLDLSLVWVTDLRNADPTHNQPITNTAGTPDNPVAAGWSSPLVVTLNISGVQTPCVILGIGEGENPYLYSFIYCLNAKTGNVIWIYCTCQFITGKPNPVNQLPASVVTGTPPAPFTVFNGTEVTRGCSVWSAIAYDPTTGYLYATTGQPASPTNPNIDQGLPSVGWSSGIMALNAANGNFVAFSQMPSSTAYRPTDLDVDIGSAPTLYTLPSGQRVVAVGCKNGGFMVCDAKTLKVLNVTSLLPRMANGDQIPRIDPHPPVSEQNTVAPLVPNNVSNQNWGENYFGPFNTAAVHPPSGTLFIGIGGPNYHLQGPGIDSETTPFMKVIDWATLKDKWALDSQDPPHYANVGATMYQNPGESGLSSPAVVNDVVFVTTSWVSIYAYKVSDGTPLWSDQIGQQTGGLNGGYGYCLGPAIWGNYVVAGALILGSNTSPGGVLNIYGLLS